MFLWACCRLIRWVNENELKDDIIKPIREGRDLQSAVLSKLNKYASLYTISFLLSTGKWWPCQTDTLLLQPSAELCPPAPYPDRAFLLPAVDWSTLIGGFARWFFGLAPPPPGAGVRSQQPVVPCAPPSPSLHTRPHAQGKTRTRCTSLSLTLSVSQSATDTD